jgi:hypothetical protein
MRLFFMLISMLSISGCHIYSFTGASIDANVKKVRVKTFSNQANLVVPALSQKLTVTLKNKFITYTNLIITEESDTDLDFDGVITEYRVTAVAAQAGETVALNRLTITVNVNFKNNRDSKQSWESPFSRFADFDSSKDLAVVQDALINDIADQIAEAIFQKAVVNW